MLEQTVTVLRVAGADAWVLGEARSACGRCAGAAHCGTGVLAGVFGKRQREFRVPNALGAVPGERVVVAVADRTLLRASAVAYLLPLAVMVTAAVLGERSGLGEGGVAVAALLGLALGMLLVGRASGRAAGRYSPQMLRRATEISFVQF